MDWRVFWIMFGLLFVAALFIRFYDLTNRPIHHDEGVIGFFKLGIVNSMRYVYDPDYHGPFEYFFGAIVFWIFGANDFTLRAPECLFNLLTILLLIPLRKNLGDAGTLTAAGLLAVSPSMVYYAQRAYMDNFFLFFTVALIVCCVKLFETGQKRWLLLGAFDLALLFTTKETAFIISFIFVVFAGLEYMYGVVAATGRSEKLLRDVNAALRWVVFNAGWLVAAFMIFVLTYVLIYTTFLFNLGNLQLALEKSLSFWLERSTTWTGHFKPYYYWWDLLSKYEAPVLALSLAGIFLAFRRGPFGRFCAWWTVASFIIYSAIPYKTPWLDVHLILPMAFVAGLGMDELSKVLNARLLAIPVAGLLLLSAYVAWDVTYSKYADGDVLLVYVQSVDNYKKLVADIEGASNKLQGRETEITVTATEYWPLPWHLRDYTRVGWWGRPVPDQSTPIVISAKGDYSDIREDLRGSYRVEKYDVRPGVIVYVYYRR